MEPLRCFQAFVTKAQTSVVESRDSGSPGLVTHVLIPLLESIGSPVDEGMPRLRKRVRDDANIEVTEFPWRRLPLWIAMRVGIQRQLQISLGNEAGRAHYKFLVTALLTEFLLESSGKLAPELTLTLRAKICRRLAKLKQDRIRFPVYDLLFNATASFFEQSIAEVTQTVHSAWEKFKRATTRAIPRLPERADFQAQVLSLPNSGRYLRSVLELPHLDHRTSPSPLVQLPSLRGTTIEQVEQFTDMYYQLAAIEDKIEAKKEPRMNSYLNLELRCEKLADSIIRLISTVGAAYDSDPEQTSIFILSLFSLWVRLDECVAEICPMILEYHPVFDPELLDALHLPDIASMRRLRTIQSYLRNRRDKCKHRITILSEAKKRSFTVRYVKKSDSMQKLHEKIQLRSEKSREKKTLELDKWSSEFDEHSSGISGGTCTCTFKPNGTRNVRGCTKCWHWRERRRMEIYAHEDFLSNDPVRAAAVIFEVGIPKSIAAYRDATWKIIMLAYPGKPQSATPALLLKDYEPLTVFASKTFTNITIASTCKSFRGTHYKVSKKKMKASESDVLYPNGLNFSLFDAASNTWVKDFHKPLTFQHCCGVHMPFGLRSSVIPNELHPPTVINGSSSYEIVASEPQCPTGVSVQEFTACQRLLSGKNRRWMTMLVELGASNVNFSSQDTMDLFNHLAVQAGSSKDKHDTFGDIHAVFKDDSFCECLAAQVEKRLSDIVSNWREVHCMEILITLSLRLDDLTSLKRAKSILLQARHTTLAWITRLRTDVRNAKDATIEETAARYAFWAALLCRRTFSNISKSHDTISENDLSTFVQASLALQENLLVDVTKLQPVLKKMLVRDAKMTYEIKHILLQSIQASPKSIGNAINEWWSSDNSFDGWQRGSPEHERWLMSIMTTSRNPFATGSLSTQVIHYNFVEGHLLVDGKPMGRLPRDIRESNEVKQLFGMQHLLTFPCAKFGMSYALVSRVNHHEIYFGYRRKRIIIRALYRNQLLEYVPSHLFVGPESVDLPDGLISNCAWRNDRTLLVDPHSRLFHQVSDIFQYFEDPHKITVFQPVHPRARLSVELRHLELSFFVNSKGLLQCRESNEEIDPNQDIGTLYGFESKLVLRDSVNKRRRSVIAPRGQISAKRRGMHVAVQAASSTGYTRFGIDDVLGRLSCPPEPVLLYAKAQFHAYTSFAIPDPLPGRTGTEEALSKLQSGYCQPWQPLGPGPIEILQNILSLSPKREWYPEHKQALQTVSWNPNLTSIIQHDAYEELAQNILHKSDSLRVFQLDTTDNVKIGPYIPSHLRRRGLTRRYNYEPSASNFAEAALQDQTHKSRGQKADSIQARKVHEVANLFKPERFEVCTDRELSEVLQDWKLIGGFHDIINADVASLSDLVDKDVDEQWGSLVNICRDCDMEEDPYSIMFRLAVMTLNPKTDLDVVKTLAAFALLPTLRAITPPLSPSYNHFRLNETPSLESIFRVISVDLPDIRQTTKGKEERAHRKKCELEGKKLAQHFVDQWPEERVTLDGFDSDFIDVGLALERVIPEWERLHANLLLSEYVIRVQDSLRSHKGQANALYLSAWNYTQESFNGRMQAPVVPSITKELLNKSLKIHSRSQSSEPIPSGIIQSSNDTDGTTKVVSKESIELRQILSDFTQTSSPLRQQYGHNLEMSLDALEKMSRTTQDPHIIPSIVSNARYIQDVRKEIVSHLSQIRQALSDNDDRFSWLTLGNLWPCTTSTALLGELRSSSFCEFGSGTIEALGEHGILITRLQQLLRIQDALYHSKDKNVQDELQNPGHENWSVQKYPDWLLLEIESDILIRRQQVDVAHAIIAPESRMNTVLQLNMGKGKTSCIVPMAMAVLGDGKQLSRLIVPKSLLLPTAQMIQSRLGGLVGREIRHIPFSRKTNVDVQTLELYKNLHREIQRNRGIILTAPEHLLSWKLSGLQYLSSSKLQIAHDMISFQGFLNSVARDVLDESDVSLAVKTQLIYPSGKLTTVDGHPHRWQVAQSLLSLVQDQLPDLEREFPRKIEVLKRDKGYPMIYILHGDVEEGLHRRIVDEICTGRTSFLPLEKGNMDDCSPKIRKVLLEYPLDSQLLTHVVKLFPDENVAFKTLSHIRGLLSNRILLLCLRKRWNVQYGLHPCRDPMAVPFEAKGVPSEQAEFGHPDAAIIFTCLAFYYTGLNQRQLREALRYILTSHDPASEYDRWTNTCDSLPDALHHWNVINVDDHDQVEELWSHLRTNKNVLDHYMNNYVFPMHAKQFDFKLQASGWDLPLFSRMESGTTLMCAKTTGFSGTNDNKTMLPLTIQQSDLPGLHQTNAEVLTYLLQDRNRSCHLVAQDGRRLSEIGFLKQLKNENIRILIDAGAYILEMSNEDLVREWMDIDTEPPAAVYCGADNRAWVRYRGAKAPVPLLATPLADNLHKCLVYFDEAHTRGIDLKLPQYAVGALTLALGQTKDHTVQAAMRLRQLATTQSVCFFAFPETYQSIVDVCGLNEHAEVNSSHVVRWLLEQTCRSNEQLQSLYISQGTDFCNRTNAEWENSAFLSDSQDRGSYVEVLQHPEQLTLQQLYGGSNEDTHTPASLKPMFPQLQKFKDKLGQLRLHMSSVTDTYNSSALEEVEQEREIEFQVEEVREVQKPPKYHAHEFPGLHPAIQGFVFTGSLPGDKGYEHVYDAVARTSIGKMFRVGGTDSRLFVSAEFMKTVKEGLTDNFLRPVERILYNPATCTALIIIAEEAEILIPLVRSQAMPPKVHLLTYSAPVTKKMLQFSNLRYYSLPPLNRKSIIPPNLTVELGIFAGRLYMNYDECAPLMQYIENAPINRNYNTSITRTIGFILQWLSLRRKGQDIMHTPLGYVCQGRPLDSQHAFFVTNHAVGASVVDSYHPKGTVTEVQDEDQDSEDENWSDFEDC